MKYMYHELWKRLIDKDLKKIDLQHELNLSPNTIAKMGKGEAVSLNVLYRIAIFLQCDIGDLISINQEELNEFR